MPGWQWTSKWDISKATEIPTFCLISNTDTLNIKNIQTRKLGTSTYTQTHTKAIKTTSEMSKDTNEWLTILQTYVIPKSQSHGYIEEFQILFDRCCCVFFSFFLLIFFFLRSALTCCSWLLWDNILAYNLYFILTQFLKSHRKT